MRSGNGIRRYTSLCKIKIMIAGPTMRSNGWANNFFIFNFTTTFIQPSFQPSFCLANITKITGRIYNKIGKPLMEKKVVTMLLKEVKRGWYLFKLSSRRNTCIFLLGFDTLRIKWLFNFALYFRTTKVNIWKRKEAF